MSTRNSSFYFFKVAPNFDEPTKNYTGLRQYSRIEISENVLNDPLQYKQYAGPDTFVWRVGRISSPPLMNDSLMLLLSHYHGSRLQNSLTSLNELNNICIKNSKIICSPMSNRGSMKVTTRTNIISLALIVRKSEDSENPATL